MNLRKQSVVCLVVAGICTLMLAAYMAGPTLQQPYSAPAYVAMDRSIDHIR
ncbi:MAG: hypothetical protein P4L33_15295 [Capsulimonadaceae bacterium]|nr:hypothetical protein [Capsulimonadaceae bacterium]